MGFDMAAVRVLCGNACGFFGAGVFHTDFRIFPHWFSIFQFACPWYHCSTVDTDDQRTCMADLWKVRNKKQGTRTDLKKTIVTPPTSPPRSGEVSGLERHPALNEATKQFKVGRTKIEKADKLRQMSVPIYHT
jgi:hypothetical protein